MEKKRACKLCFRRFPNGRALGGHMRSHVTRSGHLPYSTSSSDEEDEAKVIGSSYALRENPRKSIRLADPEFLESKADSSMAPLTVSRRSERTRRALPELVSSVPDTTPEEDVARCLMMLSRDSWTKSMAGEQQLDGADDEDGEEEEWIAVRSHRRGWNKHECGTCGRVFRSYQALGGHRTSHKKAEGRLQTGRSCSDQRWGSHGQCGSGHRDP